MENNEQAPRPGAGSAPRPMHPEGEHRVREFVNSLRRLAHPEHEDREALAILRRGLSRPPGEDPALDRYIAPYLGPECRLPDRWFYVVGSLFGLYSDASGNNRSLGESFRGADAERESTRARFLTLLACDSDDLPGQLRHAISLLKAHEAPVNWEQLLRDLLCWEQEERTVQRRWARHFFYQPRPEQKGTDDDE